MNKKKVVFLTGTRADYGKLKPLMIACEKDDQIDNHIFVIGMHLLKEYGYTISDIEADKYRNIYKPDDYIHYDKMELNLAETIVKFSDYVNRIKPDIIVVHGDRVEPLAGAIVGVMNNIMVAHIEGGEVTGTADEFMRHAITKMSNIHFVANDEAKFRLMQLGEAEKDIHIIGSPDIDIMVSNDVPLASVKSSLSVSFDKYAILIYHPVTTCDDMDIKAKQIADSVIESGDNYIVIKPNNDNGSEFIRKEWKRFENNDHFMVFDSIQFESFLCLLKNADYIIGNSSAGVREACVYGVPAIDIGTRQNNRYRIDAIRNIQHCKEATGEVLRCIKEVDKYRVKSSYYGDGHSSEKFMNIIKNVKDGNTQKQFVETKETSNAILNYINEVCF